MAKGRRSPSSSPSSLEETAGFAGGLLKQVRLVWRLLRDNRISGWLKLIPLVGFIYLLSPIDLIPDLMLPGLGELDDLAIILLSLKAFVDMSPQAIVREHMDKLMGRRSKPAVPEDLSTEPFIEVPYRVIDEDSK